MSEVQLTIGPEKHYERKAILKTDCVTMYWILHSAYMRLCDDPHKSLPVEKIKSLVDIVEAFAYPERRRSVDENINVIIKLP